MGLKNKNSSTNVDRPAPVENPRYFGKAGRSEGTKNVQKTAQIEQKWHKCQVCGHATLYKGNLKVHMRIHTDERPYQCNNCSRRFHSVSNLNVHQREHVKRYKFHYVECGLGFRKESDKNAHDKECENRRYECYLCKPSSLDICTEDKNDLNRRKRTFNTTKFKKDLKHHMQRHTGEKPFLCYICNKRFARKSYIKIHMEKVHNRANR